MKDKIFKIIIAGIDKYTSSLFIPGCFFLALLAAIILSGCDGAVDATPTDLVQPDYSYEFDGWGTNPDIYEFTPKSNTDYICIYAKSGSDSPISMFCIPKKRGE